MSKSPPDKAFPNVFTARIASIGSLRLTPYHAQVWHGNRATNAHYHEEVEVSAEGHASVPPSGAGAAALPAGAFTVCFVLCYYR
jgi:hypothetical protein